ncbi:MAG: recombinase family protein [Clostridia bacterium]|nr:recombinase family protein [Clostridia bacterium]
MKKKVAIYIRVSTVHQLDKESLPFQRRELTNYAKYVLNINDFEIFEDAGYSGKNTLRPAFQDMMKRVRNYEFTHILVWKIDRISRNIIDFANMFNELKIYNVTFVSKNEAFDTSSAVGEAILKIILIFAELERNLTSERVTDIMISKAESGDWNGGRIPFGYDYDKDNKIFSINEKEANIVRLIYDYYIESKSMTKVADYLREHSIVNRNNNFFSTTYISMILNNLFYIGIYRYNYRKEGDRSRVKPESEWITTENHHPAIISCEVYEKVKEIKSKNRKLMNSEKKIVNKQNTHIFRGLLTCVCGGNMTASLGKARVNGYKPSKYACHNRIFGHKCENPYVSDPYLGNFVLNFVSNLYKAYSSFGKTTTFETFKKKTLRGRTFECVQKISGLENIYNIFKLRERISDKNKFIKDLVRSKNSSASNNQIDIVSKEKEKHKRALDRLQKLYLYSDDGISEHEYVNQKKEIEKSIEELNLKVKDNVDNSIIDDEFIKLASCFILEQNLEEKREIDFVRLATAIDTKVIQIFIENMFQNFCIKNGKIINLTLKNGITITFYYKN